VQSIHAYAQRIQKLVPHARIVIGHGQMSAQELDTVFHTFRNGEADILIATTIIENGVDIPNANTILVDRADRFGLAELYQLRGRVGRWKRRAYAYFLVPTSRELSEIATKRLQALVEANGRGGGMRIAMRDLEIRGAGDILGMEQSGHVSSIGFHLYCKLLKRTVETLRGELPSTITDTKLEFGYDARLPEDYVNASALRMEVYQRLGEASSWTEVDAIYRELEDRFGKPPGPVVWLYHLTRIRVFCSLNSFTQVRIDKVSLQAERKKGADLIQKKVLIGKARSPAALEKKVIQALKKDW
jgi:transcription-repair coupling factor (superfamily II helicase)